MNSHALDMKRRYVRELGRTAREYLETGFELFHTHRRSERSCGRAAFGTLAAALEWTLKCVLADRNVSGVFRNMPPEARILLAAPERVPEFFQWRNATVDLSPAECETIDLAECAAGYYICFPHMKQLLLPYLSFVAGQAAAGRRTILPPLTPHEFARSGYAAVRTVISLEQDAAYAEHVAFSPGEEGRRFVDEFDALRIARVAEAVKCARIAVSKRTKETRCPSPEGWNALAADCPACGEKGVFEGYSELSSGDEDTIGSGLDFFAVSFCCPGCGLALEDVEELKLAGMGMIHDRTGELDRWIAEHGDSNDWEEE
jgi:hypothetical protein